jgi:hypothetical protein
MMFSCIFGWWLCFNYLTRENMRKVACEEVYLWLVERKVGCIVVIGLYFERILSKVLSIAFERFGVV